MHAIELCHVFKSYRDFWGRVKPAVSDISLKISQGEAFGFVGPNGAGKSTTIKMLTGAIYSDQGVVKLFGLDVRDSKSRKGMGFVPESAYLPDYLTPLEILQMARRMHGLNAGNKECFTWLEKFGIAEVAKKKLRTFSKGMVQRTALAHALCGEPRLLILDEPLSGLDPIGRKEVVDIMVEYRRSGGTIFFSSHVLHDVERLADRFGLIYQGKMRTVQSPHELLGFEAKLIVRSIGSVAVDGMLLDVEKRWFGEVTQAGLWGLLDRLRKAGHEIHEVKPVLSLENAFYQYVEKTGGS